MLVTYGDGYLLASIDWPDGLAEEALPTYAQTSWFFARSGVRGWCAAQSREPADEEAVIDDPDADDATERPAFNATFEQLRERKRPKCPSPRWPRSTTPCADST